MMRPMYSIRKPAAFDHLPARRNGDAAADARIERASLTGWGLVTGLVMVTTAVVLVVVLPRSWRSTTHDAQGAELLIAAAGCGDVAGVRRALDSGVSPDATQCGVCALRGTYDPDIARLLLQRGASVEGPNDSGTPLAQAAMTHRIAVMRVLLKAGADPNRRPAGKRFSPLEAAGFTQDDEAVRLLLEFGASPAGVNDAGE
jgi:hypothetical protein